MNQNQITTPQFNINTGNLENNQVENFPTKKEIEQIEQNIEHMLLQNISLETYKDTLALSDAKNRPQIITDFYKRLVETVDGWQYADPEKIANLITLHTITELRRLGYAPNGEILDKGDIESAYDDNIVIEISDTLSVADSVITQNPNLDTKEKQLRALRQRAYDYLHNEIYLNENLYDQLEKSKETNRFPSLKKSFKDRVNSIIKKYNYNEVDEEDKQNIIDTLVNFTLSYYGFDSLGKDLQLKRNVNKYKMSKEEKELYDAIWNLPTLNPMIGRKLLKNLIKIYMPLYSYRNIIPYDKQLLINKKYDTILQQHKNVFKNKPSKLFSNKDISDAAFSIKLDTDEFKNIKNLDDRRRDVIDYIKKEVEIYNRSLTPNEEKEVINTLFAQQVNDGLFNDLIK